MTDRKTDRGFYKPRSYRFSNVTHHKLKKLGKEFGSQEKALKHLLSLKKGL